jgi:hypothetical protein
VTVRRTKPIGTALVAACRVAGFNFWSFALLPDSLQAHFQARDLHQGPAEVPIEQKSEPGHDPRVVVQNGDVSVARVLHG